MSEVITAIFGTITETITNFATSIGQAVSSVGNMFYTNGEMTFLGTLLLLAVGVGLIYWAFRLIRGLIRRA